MVSVASTNITPKEKYERYRLAIGVQLRQEKSGLLFYSQKGPRLYFLGSGELLAPDFFGSGWQLKTWLDRNGIGDTTVRHALAEALRELEGKGVLNADPGSA
jgi:putative mycofactocin binding protein MftB